MLYKALILLAAVSAIAADDVQTQVYKKLNEFNGLYVVLANETYKVAAEGFSQTNHLIVELTKGLQGNFSYDNVTKTVSDLNAQAKELGKDISICLRRHFATDLDLYLYQSEEITMTIQSLQSAYFKYSPISRSLDDDSLRYMKQNLTQKGDKYDTNTAICLRNSLEVGQNSCLWGVLTELELDAALFQAEASELDKSLEYEAAIIGTRLPAVVLENVASWNSTLEAVVDNIERCAEDIFNDGDSTVTTEGTLEGTTEESGYTNFFSPELN